MIINPYQFGFSYDPDAWTYILAVEAADGQALESATRLAIDKFVKGLKADNLWTAMGVAGIAYCSRTKAGAFVALKGPATTEVTTVGYSRTSGLQVGTGNGLNLNVLAADVSSQNNVHMAVWITVRNTNANRSAFGDFSASGSKISLFHSSTQFTPTCYTSVTDSFGSSGLQLMGVARNNSANFIARNRKSSITFTRNSAPLADTDNNLWVCAAGTAANLPTAGWRGRVAFWSAGTYLDLPTLEARVETLITELDAAIP
jgi:hypothetical protein